MLQLRAAAERAFWDVLAEGLAESPPAWRRLAALVTDAREQLAELVPPNDNPAAQALRLQLHDKLETVGETPQTYQSFGWVKIRRAPRDFE